MPRYLVLKKCFAYGRLHYEGEEIHFDKAVKSDALELIPEETAKQKAARQKAESRKRAAAKKKADEDQREIDMVSFDDGESIEIL